MEPQLDQDTRTAPPTRMMLRVTAVRFGVAALALLLAFGCGGDSSRDGLWLEVSSEAAPSGERIDRLRMLLSNGTERVPEDAESEQFNFVLPEDTDITAKAVHIKVTNTGTSFAADAAVRLRILGYVGAQAVTAWEGGLELGANDTVKARLEQLNSACDADGDGYVDCAVEGCCEGGSSPFGDCGPNDEDTHPWGVEPACVPCGGEVDRDCSGTLETCDDGDGDGIADCEETACGADDGTVGEGLPELCDGKDNDCDGYTDEGFGYGPDSLPPGSACGLGVCAGGKVECASLNGPAVCSTDENAAVEEDCSDGKDNDCDGVVNNDCSEEDYDGDGFLEPEDCDNHDAGKYPEAPEPCCSSSLDTGGDPANPSEAVRLACDYNCDGKVSFCAADDVDGDGFGQAADCNDNDASVFPGAPEKCGDEIDQDCFGGDLPCEIVGDDDGDKDGYAAVDDCDDDNVDVYPGAAEKCDGLDNDCDGLVDEGNPGGGAVCGKNVGECKSGIEVCIHTGDAPAVVCVGEVEATDEVCDLKDNDCNGKADDGLAWNGIPVGQHCDGTGACGSGIVECSTTTGQPTCSSNADGSQSDATPEVCDKQDNDCDGEVNEGLNDVAKSTCKQQGLCGKPDAQVVATCNPDGTWSCDYSKVSGYSDPEAACDGIDNDCDGEADEDFGVGQGCGGDACPTGVVKCNPDGDGTYCHETGDSTESCDGQDNDCDGLTDEDFTDLGDACDGPDSDLCANGVRVCSAGGSATVCGTETEADILEICDDADNDCDGATDEGFTGKNQACDGEDADQCQNGTWTCSDDGSVLECVNESVEDVPEMCNGNDDDCDGETDEGFTLDVACDGDDSDQCAFGVLVCNTVGDGTECGPETFSDLVEDCDGFDNDCDGSTDEDLTTDTVTAGCLYKGVCEGAVDAIVVSCSEAQWVCDHSGINGWVPTEGHPADCDGLDNDCDGLTDEESPDLDYDGLANCVDSDIDGDTIDDNVNGQGTGTPCQGGTAAGCDDNCPYDKNTNQEDMDNDAEGDVCDPDRDGDGVDQDTGQPNCTDIITTDCADNCPDTPNPGQEDDDGDGVGNACDALIVCTDGETSCDPTNPRVVRTCLPDGSGWDPALEVECGYVCWDGACRYASNLADADVASCGPGDSALNPPAGAVVYVSDTGLTCSPSCGGVTSIAGSEVDSPAGGKVVAICLSSMTLASGVVINRHATNPITLPVVFVVDGDVTIIGQIGLPGSVGNGTTGSGGRPGNGGGAGANNCPSWDWGCDGLAGSGPGGGGGSGGGTTISWNAGGAGGGGFGGTGGDGGDADSTGGAGGGTYGNAELEPLQGGSGGGSPGDAVGGSYYAPGGGGGGAVQITARGTVAVGGVIWCDGGDGYGGATGGFGAGGGGSGGGILIEAPTVDLLGWITVWGGDGGDSAGGAGGAGATDTLDGGDGANGGSTSNDDPGGAGGGGGAGRIRVNAVVGAHCDAPVMEPAAACTFGELKP